MSVDTGVGVSGGWGSVKVVSGSGVEVSSQGSRSGSKGAGPREKMIAFLVRYRILAVLNWRVDGVGRARVEHVFGITILLRRQEGVKRPAQVV